MGGRNITRAWFATVITSSVGGALREALEIDSTMHGASGVHLKVDRRDLRVRAGAIKPADGDARTGQ